jgi:hypothetical protein
MNTPNECGSCHHDRSEHGNAACQKWGCMCAHFKRLEPNTVPRPIGSHEMPCQECAVTWLCCCGSKEMHGYLTSQQHYCPLCRDRILEEKAAAFRKRHNVFHDPAGDYDDMFDQGGIIGFRLMPRVKR